MRFRNIPQPTGNQQEINRAVKENLESLAGLRNNTIKPLDAAATTADIIAKINELVSRLQA